jgi:hypothetical protein
MISCSPAYFRARPARCCALATRLHDSVAMCRGLVGPPGCRGRAPPDAWEIHRESGGHRPGLRPHGTKVYSPHVQKSQTTNTGFGGLTFRRPAASALPGGLALGRALRPLMRRVPSHTRFVLDEEATTQRMADERQWRPVLRPALSRWLEVALVIDEWPSKVIWRQTIAELQRLLERQGAFRNLRTWGFTTDPPKGRVRLRAGTGLEASQNWARSPRELIDLRGQRLILMVSDCVSLGWFSGEVARMLATWGQHGLAAIVQRLPERLWRHSALGNAASVH